MIYENRTTHKKFDKNNKQKGIVKVYADGQDFIYN